MKRFEFRRECVSYPVRNAKLQYAEAAGSTSSTADFVTGLLFGLLSSLHCAQMCGPLVLAYSLPMEGRRETVPGFAPGLQRRAHCDLRRSRSPRRLRRKHDELPRPSHGIANAAAIGAGALLVVAGIAMFGVLPGTKRIALHRHPSPASCDRWRTCSRRRASPAKRTRPRAGSPAVRPVVRGVFEAMATASPYGGAMTMLASESGPAARCSPSDLLLDDRRMLAPWRKSFVAAPDDLRTARSRGEA
jgi:hypothetical protein